MLIKYSQFKTKTKNNIKTTCRYLGKEKMFRTGRTDGQKNKESPFEADPYNI